MYWGFAVVVFDCIYTLLYIIMHSCNGYSTCKTVIHNTHVLLLEISRAKCKLSYYIKYWWKHIFCHEKCIFITFYTILLSLSACVCVFMCVCVCVRARVGVCAFEHARARSDLQAVYSLVKRTFSADCPKKLKPTSPRYQNSVRLN